MSGSQAQSEKARAIVLHRSDNVATMIDEGRTEGRILLIGDVSGDVVLHSQIPFGHKCAIRSISQGEDVLKYGQVIGRASQNIEPGAHVHVHNVETLRARGDPS